MSWELRAKLGPAGQEPNGVTNNSDKGLQNSPQRGGALSGAESGVSGDFDPELQKVIDAWNTLPQAVRQDIAATVEAHSTRGVK